MIRFLNWELSSRAFQAKKKLLILRTGANNQILKNSKRDEILELAD